MHRKIACAHVPVWFVKISNWLSDPKESSIVYRDVIFISTKQKVSIVCEMIRPINVCVKRKAVVIRKLIHRWYQSYENTLPNTIRNSTNWLARIWDGQRNKKKKISASAYHPYPGLTNVLHSRISNDVFDETINQPNKQLHVDSTIWYWIAVLLHFILLYIRSKWN